MQNAYPKDDEAILLPPILSKTELVYLDRQVQEKLKSTTLEEVIDSVAEYYLDWASIGSPVDRRMHQDMSIAP